MNDTQSPIWSGGTTEVNRTGTWRNRIPIYITRPSPCRNACPVRHDIATWMQQIKNKDFYGAWLTMIANSPFPAVAGRVCHHPCEAGCNRAEYDEEISICALERYIGDMAILEEWSFPETPISKQQKIAIVGAGPAGLACAFHLRRMGYPVTLYEAQSRAGGLLYYGIPPYRLPKEILDGEIKRILRLGVELKTDAPIESPGQFQELRDNYDAVYLAAGAAVPRRLPELDYRHERMMDSKEYLARANSGLSVPPGDHVAVIGGGSAAMDVARTARRYGKRVTILALESEKFLPCQEEELREAREEDIALINSVMLQGVTEGDKRDFSLNCIEVVFTPGEDGASFNVETVPGTEFSLAADTIVSAIGQEPDLDILGSETSRQDSLLQVDAGQRTNMEGVFGGGDMVTMERFVTNAFGMGKNAAGEIHYYLNAGKSNTEKKEAEVNPRQDGAGRNDVSTPVSLQEINTWYYAHLPRRHQGTKPVQERLGGFDETQIGLDSESALQEAERCFSCGHCIYCNHCLFHCPDMAITREQDGYRVNTDYCKGCGLCVRECPTGAVKMFEDRS